MSTTVRSFLLLVVLLVVTLVWRSGAETAAVATSPLEPRTVDAAQRAATFAWVGVAPADQAAVAESLRRIRPDARRLIEVVDGLVRVEVGAVGGGAAGSTRPTAEGFDMKLDLGGVQSTLGPRGLERLVLHELGHVVDFALVPADVDAAMDAQIPKGYGCEDGLLGSCAEPEERFAESFAKWATGDIGVGLSIGYKVPPPAVPLDVWAAPLAALGG